MVVLLRYHLDTGVCVGSVAGAAVLLTCSAWRTGPLLAATVAAFAVVSLLAAVGLALLSRHRVVIRHDPPRKARENSLQD